MRQSISFFISFDYKIIAHLGQGAQKRKENIIKTAKDAAKKSAVFRLHSFNHYKSNGEEEKLSPFSLFLCLPLALAVLGRRDADDLLELMHKVDIIAVAALICDIGDAVIGA